MDVNILNLHDLFVKPGCYKIPLFQRSYAWEQDDQWGPLWEDVQNTAEYYLEQDAKGAAHFLGAIVLQQQSTRAGRLDTRIVVDGQQRLITLQLLLDAVQEVFEEFGADLASKRLARLVLNEDIYVDDDPNSVFKVWPTQSDQAAFRHAMDNDLPSKQHQDSPIVQAHEFFKSQARQWLNDELQENGTRVGALEQAVTELLELVVIDLDHSDDPHVIFETLNARGTPLLQSDLIKNMVLQEAKITGTASDSEDVTRADRLWSFNDRWWKEEITQGRLLRPRIDVFLNYWLIMRMRYEVAPNNVFSVFRRYYNGQRNSIDEVAADVRRVGEIYRVVERESSPDIATFLYRRRVMQAGILTPVLLWLLSSEVPRQQLEKSLRALESHLVRRMVCRMTTRGYNRLFLGLLNNLEEAGAELAGDTIVDYLKGRTAYAEMWPGDQQLQDAFTTQPLYRLLTKGRLRIVLEGIEEELRTIKAESQTVPRDLTIEHIMPQQWRQHWPLSTNVEDWERDQLIHSIGNLTLVNNLLNLDLSNAPWQGKQATLGEHSVLFLNKTLLDKAPEVWDEAAIAARAKRLCQVATRVWPHADNI